MKVFSGILCALLALCYISLTEGKTVPDCFGEISGYCKLMYNII